MDQKLETEIIKYGEKIFSLLGTKTPKGFGKKSITNKIMNWSLSKPDLKVNLFRLVDVLPALNTSTSVAKHVDEYLANNQANLGKLMDWGLKLAPVVPSITNFAVKQSVKEMASTFIAGSDPVTALPKLKKLTLNKLSFTVDLLGEYSVSEKEAVAYLDRYLNAIKVIGDSIPTWPGLPLRSNHPGCIRPGNVSVKLSALYSQCGVLNYNRSIEVLSERLLKIVKASNQANVGIYIDAEDTQHNPIIYEVFKNVFSLTEFLDYPYPGIVLQAYAKESYNLAKDLLAFAEKRGAPIAIRLVKGAYWDSETATAEINQWENPLFDQKHLSDQNYEKLAALLLDNTNLCLPALGSHNIRSLCFACCYAEAKNISKNSFELQMLYGMADPIAKAFVEEGYLVRMYVPLGDIIPGMGYLVRRLLENTSNESFLKNTFVDKESINSLLVAP